MYRYSNFVLDLSLSSALPAIMGKKNHMMAASSANALACQAVHMEISELRELKNAISPLLTLLVRHTEDPASAKASGALRSLLRSRVCTAEFLGLNGLIMISQVFDYLVGHDVKQFDLKTPSIQRETIENIVGCYRELSNSNPWDVVRAGGLRHCVICLRFGDTQIQTIAIGAMTALSMDVEISKQMFINGAVRPLIDISDADITNEACMLAGLGCLVQLCRTPEIAVKVVQQGAVSLLEKAIHRKKGILADAVREKTIYVLGWISRVSELRQLLCENSFLRGIKREMKSGSETARYTCLHILLNLHGCYTSEAKFIAKVREVVLRTLEHSNIWFCRNLGSRVICVVYTSLEDKLFFAQNGAIHSLFNLLHAKPSDLQETPIVALMSLCVHSDVPKLILKENGAKILTDLLEIVRDNIIQDLIVILLKILALYDFDAVNEAVTPATAHLLARDDVPDLYGSEYGGFILEFMQKIVHNRREMHYLFEQLSGNDVEELNLKGEEMSSFENTFMEIDSDCLGTLGIDELKLLVILMGEQLDEDELQELLDDYSKEREGKLTFKEFIIMMKDWDTRFGEGIRRLMNVATKRGAVRRAGKHLDKYLNKEAIEKAEVEEVKRKRREERELLQIQYVQYNPHVQLMARRELAKIKREYYKSQYQEEGY